MAKQETTNKKRKNKKTQAFVQLGLMVGILLFINILGSANFDGTALYGHLDLTEENRFTLTSSTHELLQNLDEVVYVRVLLEGEFPAGFKRLQEATREMLNDYRTESGLIEYQFEDVNQGTVEEINQRRQTLADQGITPTLFRVQSVEGSEERLIYPYAIFNYKGRTVPVNLLEEQGNLSQEIVLNNSINLLEYKFSNAIQKLQLARKPIIAFTTGHGELSELQTKDLVVALRPFYELGRFNLDSNYQVPPQIDLLILAKPTQPFSERDKFMLDQYIMNGGKTLWLLDKVAVSLDSLRADGSSFVPRDFPTNLDDLLFKYGVRIQPNLLLDLQCSKIPLVVSMQNGLPQTELFPYFYHPVIIPTAEHPIVKSLSNLNLMYPSRVDTVRTKEPVQKTILLKTSQYTREQFLPVRLNFEILRYDPEPSQFDKGPQPVAALLEGSFTSLYENRVSDNMNAMLNQIGSEYRSTSVDNKMIVVADGDMAANIIVDRENRGVLPLGYNRFEKQQYSNKDFLINCVEYLLDDYGVIEARGKEIRLRLLDIVQARQEKSKWQFLNIAVPVLFIGLFGFAYNFWRRRRYR